MNNINKIYKGILKGYIKDDEIVNYDFDYTFNIESSVKNFQQEFNKFLVFTNEFFYNGNRLVTSINSYEINLKVEVLTHLLELLLYSKSKCMHDYEFILYEFIFTYYRSIAAKEYKEIVGDFKKRNQLLSLLNNLGVKEYFFQSQSEILSKFYYGIFTVAVENDYYIDSYFIRRFANNLGSEYENYNEIFNMLIRNEKNMSTLIDYDKEVKTHKVYYLKEIYESFNKFNGYNYIGKYLKKLVSQNCLTEDEIKSIINRYIGIVNDICLRTIQKKENSIQIVSEIENIKSGLNLILQLFSKDEAYKDKILESIKILLFLKRRYLSDDEHINSSMQVFNHEQVIEHDKIDKVKKEIKGKNYALFKLFSIDFSSEMGNALKMYANHPISSLITNINIDSRREVYSILNKEINQGDYYKLYYDQIGIDYTIKNSWLLNKLDRNYYEEMLHYLSKYYVMQIGLWMLLLEEEIKDIIEEINEKIKYNNNYEYINIANNILSVEYHVISLLKTRGIESKNSGKENLMLLFDSYDDKRVKDGIMYLNYILYEPSGFNLRNNIMHGNIIGDKESNNQYFKICLTLSYSIFIFICGLVDE